MRSREGRAAVARFGSASEWNCAGRYELNTGSSFFDGGERVIDDGHVIHHCER